MQKQIEGVWTDFVVSLGSATACHPSKGVIAFEVRLSREKDEEYGLAYAPVEDDTDTLVVVGVKDPGVLATWNQEQTKNGMPEYVVGPGDRISQVCGTRGRAEMMSELLCQDRVHFLVERWPEAVSVLLEKRQPDQRFGMEVESVAKLDGTVGLQLTKIHGDALLALWNWRALAEGRLAEVVHVGSEIVQVQQCRGQVEAMVAALQTDSRVQLRFKRPDVVVSGQAPTAPAP